MEVIDKTHDEISTNHGRHGLAAYISFNNAKTIYISSGACRRFKIKAGYCANFVNDDNDWMFYVDSNEDGFKLSERQDKNACLIINASLISLFLKRTRCSIPCKFPLTLVNAKLDGYQLIKN